MKSAQHSFIIALVLGAVVTLAPVSRAQQSGATSDRPVAGQRERRGGGPAGTNAFDRMATQLKLTAEQKGKLQPIYREEMTKMRELRQDTTLTAEQRREKMRTIREEYLGKMKPVLTSEQFEQLKKTREAAATRGPRGARQGGQGQRQAPPASGDKPQP